MNRLICQDCHHLEPHARNELSMVAMNTAVADAICVKGADTELLREYDDGPDWPVNSLAKEQAYRQGFVEGARHVVKVWAHPPGPVQPDLKLVSMRDLIDQRRCDPFAEAEAAWQLRQRVRERFTVYRAGDAGRKTYHLGYRPGHAVAAARLRGRHHAMVHVLEPWHHIETSDVDIFNPYLLHAWWRAVQRWAAKPIRPGVISPPPRLLARDRCGEYEAHGQRRHFVKCGQASPS